MELSKIERVLETYTLEEILELNDLTTEEILIYLVEQEVVEIPNPKPVDYATSDK